jgi:apolipoprotein N-acyltransferase
VTSSPEPDPAGKTPAPVAFRWRALAAAASAILLVMASPPMDLNWLGWIAPIPFFWAVMVGEGAQAFRRSGIQGKASKGSSALIFWLGFIQGFLMLIMIAPWFAAFSPAGYPVAGIYWGLLGGGVWALTLRAVRALGLGWAPPLLAAGWTLMEWLKTQGTLCFPWAELGTTQYRYLPVIQLLDLTGVFGLSFLMALLGASAAVRLIRYRESCFRAARWVAISAGLVVLAVARGAILLAMPPPASEYVRVAVVQASECEQEGVAVRTLSPPEEYLQRSREALAQGAELIVWPEAARQDDVVHSGFARAQIRDLTRGTSAHVLTGSFVRHLETNEDQNAGVLLNPGGDVLGQYAKVLIVPFGEYLPARPLLRWTEQLGMPATDLRAGDGWQPLPWPKGKIGVSICFEAGFGSVSRTHVREDANLLAILTSDGWVGRVAAGYQDFAFAPLRAVENRRAIARSAATGISALIDPYGRPLQKLSMFRKGVLVGDLPLRTGLTPYARLGEWPVMLSGVLLLLGLARSLDPNRRRGLSRSDARSVG